MADLAQIRRVLVQKLESLHRSGVRVMPRSLVDLPATPESSAGPPQSSPGTSLPVSEAPTATRKNLAAPTSSPVEAFSSPVLAADDRADALGALSQQVAQCGRCQELAATRTQTVFGVGNPNARLVFFGEAPGADEDRLGEPFVGKAGLLLTKIIEACTLTREDVYIMNVLRCRPPRNRNPTPAEALNCSPFFEKQFEIIRPEFICCLGSVAATTLLKTSASVGRLRGQFHTWRGMKVVVTYHPAYLLRNADAKKLVWADMKMLMSEMGVQL